MCNLFGVCRVCNLFGVCVIRLVCHMDVICLVCVQCCSVCACVLCEVCEVLFYVCARNFVFACVRV